MRVMTIERRRHIPVIRETRLVGLVSIGDVVKYRIRVIEEEHRSMREYIAQAMLRRSPIGPRARMERALRTTGREPSSRGARQRDVGENVRQRALRRLAPDVDELLRLVKVEHADLLHVAP